MNYKKNTERLWKYIKNAFDDEELECAIKEFEIDEHVLKNLDTLTEDDARMLLSDLAYMAVNGLFGGDFHTWNEVLCCSLQFDEETIDFLNY